MPATEFRIREATIQDTPTILAFIRALAEYENLVHEVVATEQTLKDTLFGKKKSAEVALGLLAGKPVAFALFFHNYSTFLGKPGIYLEDLFVIPEARGQGIGKKMLAYLAKLTVARNCGRLEWWVLNWNKAAIRFYKSLGATAMDEWAVHRLAGEALNELANEG